MKYIAVIDTDDDDYENFNFFEDTDGKYLYVKDENAKDGEWMQLHFKKAPGQSNLKIMLFKLGYKCALKDCGVIEIEDV